MRNPHKALQAIERLVGGNLGMDVEWRLADKKFRGINKKMAEVIVDIYIISHAEGQCTGHPSWENKKYDILKQDENNF